MILFVGQVGRGMMGREAFQELDYSAVFGTMAKWVVQIDDPARVPELISRAFHVATSGRPGPVVIALPEDMLTEAASVADALPYQVTETYPGAAQMAERILAVDALISPRGMNPGFVEALEGAGPYGTGWPGPRTFVDPGRAFIPRSDRAPVQPPPQLDRDSTPAETEGSRRNVESSAQVFCVPVGPIGPGSCAPNPRARAFRPCRPGPARPAAAPAPVLLASQQVGT